MAVTQRLDLHDKLVVETRSLALETRQDLRELAAQKRADASLHALIGSVRGGGNGHTRRRLD